MAQVLAYPLARSPQIRQRAEGRVLGTLATRFGWRCQCSSVTGAFSFDILCFQLLLPFTQPVNVGKRWCAARAAARADGSTRMGLADHTNDCRLVAQLLSYTRPGNVVGRWYTA